MMVRKPVATPRRQAAQGTPYPATPTSPKEEKVKIPVPPNSTSLEHYTAGTKQVDGASDPNDSPGWQEANERTRNQELPPSLAISRGRQDAESRRTEETPAVLKVGSAEVTPRSSWESQRSAGSTTNDTSSGPLQHLRAAPEQPQEPRSRSTSNNPYRPMHNSNGKAPERPEYGGDSSAEIWGGGSLSSRPYTGSTPTRHPFAEPWMQFGTSPGEETPEQEAGPRCADNTPQYDAKTGQTTSLIDQKASEAPEVHVQSPRSPRYQNPQPGSLWQGPVHSSNDVRQSPLNSSTNVGYSSPCFSDDVWDSFQTASGGTGNPPTQAAKGNGQNDDVPSSDVVKVPILPPYNQDIPPALPPRSSGEQQGITPPPQPPRPPKTNDTSSEPTLSGPETQTQREEASKMRRARETYQIRLVNWYDTSSPTNPRRSPIMVQNANGPCPLLALVNALVLSTPFGITTALVETLRIREQVSLGLLLDAVIDELMSGRRSDGKLPDVTDLYTFLVTLHTGMTVNPRFVPVEEAVNLMDAPIEGDLPTNLHAARKAGGFEDTREMKLYSTFAIPLIHGWIPPRNHPAFAALKRTAKTYEDAQNVMFREEELEERLRRQGLTPKEQLILEDIASVKYFLSTTATQLTGYGLDTMTETMAPGSIAILFRNDHFSTLYRHPRSGQLLTLVTDMGYAGHDEVVWESLVDVSGEGCEFFSGDFRPVGNVAGGTQQPLPPGDEGEWTTVGRKPRRAPRSDASTSHSNLPPLSTLNLSDNATPLSPNTVQEDHDLALAMQLQEEEEERDRQEAAARQREDELSQAYLNSSDAQGRRTFPGFGRGATGARSGPSPPPRGAGSGRRPLARPTLRKSTSTESEDAPPPSYEQAAKGPAYIPPADPPAHTYASPGPTNSTPRLTGQRPRQSTAYSEHAASYAGSPTYGNSPRQGHVPRRSTGGRGGGEPSMSRRRSGAPGSAVSLDDERKEKDCIVM